VLTGPALLLLCGRRLWTDPGLGRRLLLSGLVLMIGPTTYLLLLYWARAEPLQSWGRPTTMALLWNHASARVYGSLLHLPSGGEWISTISRAARLYWDNFPFAAAVLPLLGAAVLWLRDLRIALGLFLAFFTVVRF